MTWNHTWHGILCLWLLLVIASVVWFHLYMSSLFSIMLQLVTALLYVGNSLWDLWQVRGEAGREKLRAIRATSYLLFVLTRGYSFLLLALGSIFGIRDKLLFHSPMGRF
ncbi:MAG TPA: hypothetical protein VH593_34385 [Ktedonobacteraceae bacterium]